MNKPKKWFVAWFTWLSGAGKTTIADNLQEKLNNQNYNYIQRLDWDIVRQSLTRDLWFTPEDRAKNLERVGFVASMLSSNDVWVLATFISPYIKEREKLRNQIPNFIEIWVDAPLEVCEQRDVKWLYQKAREGQIDNFTWISDPYQNPYNPEVHLPTDKLSIDECTNKIINYLEANNYL